MHCRALDATLYGLTQTLSILPNAVAIMRVARCTRTVRTCSSISQNGSSVDEISTEPEKAEEAADQIQIVSQSRPQSITGIAIKRSLATFIDFILISAVTAVPLGFQTLQMLAGFHLSGIQIRRLVPASIPLFCICFCHHFHSYTCAFFLSAGCGPELPANL